jgi:membrane-associated phospholipid phosphatase
VPVIEGGKGPIAGCLACAGCLAILVAVAYQVAPAEQLDARVLSELAAPAGSSADSVASLFERVADWLPQVALVVVASLIALRRDRPRSAIAVVALVAGVAVITQILKIVLAHPRYQPILGSRQVGSDGFPSGHAAGAMAMALAFLLVVPHSWRPPAAVIGAGLTLAVGASVIVLNLHYPSDVLGGWLVTAGWCFALIALRPLTASV